MEKYAYSIKTVRVREPDFPYAGQQLTCTNEVINFLRDLQSSDVEKLIALYLDTQNQLLCVQITKGTSDMAVAYPKEIVRHALLVNSSAVILAHNHPSGHPKPSDSDIRLTKTLQEGAKFLDILIHDHLIIAGDTGKFFSFREEGLM
jgi:DNA repair protein RadC